MKKKGFTLVELLAVIVILAVVSIVAIPIIINLIEESKKGALKDSVEGLTKAADMYYFEHMRDVEEGVQIEIVNNEQTAPQNPRLNYKGQVKTGFVLISYDGKVAICVDDGKYYASRALDSKAIITDLGSCTNEFDDELNTFVTVGSANYSGLKLNVRALSNKPTPSDKATEGTIGIVTEDKITGYYASPFAPEEPKEGMVWVVTNNNAENFINTKTSKVGVSYALQYKDDNWELKDSYLYNDEWVQTNNYEDTEYEWLFEYKGQYQTFKAPYDGYYTIELWGGSGGSAAKVGYGLGAYTKGDIYMNKDEEIYIYVGGQGPCGAGVSAWNGGGASGGQGSSCAGGGATDVRTIATPALTTWNEVNSLRSRIMVAGGGGGSENGQAGSAGGLNSYPNNAGSVATQISGASFGGGCNYSGDGSAGGGGWFGGYCPNGDKVGGAGGSSYISGQTGCISIDAGGHITGNSVSFTKKYFLNTTMIDGQGYEWTDKKGNYVGVPSYKNGILENGNLGPGYARIRFKNFDSMTMETYNELGAKIQNTWLFNYVGYYETFIAPKAGKYRIELWGGASIGNGRGAYTAGDITLKKGQTLYIYVGQHSVSGAGVSAWNGGGRTGGSGSSNSGGGATDVRIVSTSSLGAWNEINSLKTRIMVAGGGGGSENSQGGAAGGLEGYPNNTGQKATQISGGGFGYGANYGSSDGSAAGSGWYGGYAPNADSVGGGGGSSYISGHYGCIGVNQDTTKKNTSATSVEDSYSYTGFIFENTKMIDGNGYQWTNQKGSSVVNMPTFDHSTIMIGNTSNGFARITFIK